ncbi:MAG TPA: ATP synthase F0 subunit B [Polyangiaceae bacterium]
MTRFERRRASALAVVALLAAVLLSGAAAAQGQPHEPPNRDIPGHDAMRFPRPGTSNPHGIGPARDAHGAPSQGQHAEAAHPAHAEHDEKAPPPPMNWWHGLIGEKAGAKPGLLWRAPGEPPPFVASLFNFAVLVFIVVRFGKKPLAAALLKRKDNILREIDDAQRLRKAAEERLGEYEAKLEHISVELERIRREFREQGERDKQRIVHEAKERRERMRKDTEILLSQEAKQIRQELLAEVVQQSARLATEILAKEMTLGDHDRFAEAFLAELRSKDGPRGGSTVFGSAAAKGGFS